MAEIGDQLGRFRLLELLGSGTFAAVYRAQRAGAREQVALKVLHAQHARSERIRGQFAREARILSEVTSAHLVTIFESDLAGSEPFVAMTLATEGTLQRRLDDDGPLPLSAAVVVIEHVAKGVTALHRKGFLHRDLKPSNILIATSRDGGERFMVADLGLARDLLSEETFTQQSGTAGFRAPEQRTTSARKICEQTDVHGLGAIAYYLLSGQIPVEDNRPSLSALRPEAAIPSAVDAVVSRAMADGPDRRWPSAAEFSAAFAQAATTGSIPPESGRALSSVRHRGRLIGTSVAILLAAATAIVLWGPLTEPRPKVWLRPDAGIPDHYHNAIIRAGTWCAIDGLSPALVAAMLKAESNFDPNLTDPTVGDEGEYGIARWTPSVLMAYLPEGERDRASARQIAMIPDRAIPPMGQLMCGWGRQVEDIPGDPALKLAAVYRTSADALRRDNGIPPALDAYMNTVQRHLAAYRP
ncbi:protein kinase domain-containing protein [Nonomuraea endophytica]|uniref:protein kinase domain-containing protein n=1 Tax=Nonomuraea endophytica TaxID=714136 RepID=UPI0037C87C0F